MVQEALACGLPVICGVETLNADEAARPYLTGVDVGGEGAVARLSAAIDAALESDTSASARAEFARERYSWTAAAERYAAILRA